MFLKACAEMYQEAMTKEHYVKIAASRQLPVSAFKGIGIGWDGDFYTIPISDETGTCDIRRWRPPKGAVLSTPDGKLWMWNSHQLYNPARKGERVYICEGEWDGMALQWLLCTLGEKGVVVAMPGANTFKREWVPSFLDREVYTLYDHDEAGEAGELLALERLTGTAKKIYWLHWPESLPLKFDVRDFVSVEAVKGGKPRAAWKKLKGMFREFPRRRVKGSVVVTTPVMSSKSELPPGRATRSLVLQKYRQWFHLRSADVLDVLFGTMLANRLDGDPVWMFLIAPPGGMKTELLMSLSRSSYAETTTSLTPHALVSGAVWNSGTDPSLIPRLNGKVLIIKDFTTILKMHFTARDEIFGILRDAYDGKTEKIFGTGIKRSYESRFGVVAGVTPAIDSFSVLQASLGERFLKFRIDEAAKDEDEGAIIKRALSNINKENAMRDAVADIASAYLEQDPLIRPVPTVPDEMENKIIALARVVAWLRGVVEREKYTDLVLYRPTSEIGTRLAKQLMKVGIGMCMFHGVQEMNEEIYSKVLRVARDTCADRLDDVVSVLWKLGKQGEEPVPTMDVATASGLPYATVMRILADFELLKIVRKLGSANKAQWIFTARFRDLLLSSGMHQER